MSYTTIFLIVNVVGGVLVLGGYVAGFTLFSEAKETMWGGINSSQRPIFQISMVLAAVGYLVFCYTAMFKFGDNWSNLSDIDALIIIILCASFLGTAALWLPLGLWYQETGVKIVYGLMVLALWVTALSLLTVTVILAFRTMEISNTMRIVSCLGVGYITFHCLIFDAIIWVAKFPR